ncbi:MAG: methylenetetrahydrofolate dehydrogenase (NADP+)/methenyltetrahydrofolate cyclohydrolase [Rickettsiales bacterium]|jgi:methylenetetrahydrofolate dehydrogenase (NADP+)/methenyltetrahydrofolate cyclohydrolase
MLFSIHKPQMTAKIIDGKQIAADLKIQIASQIEQIKKDHNVTPTLAVILVGADAASQIYVGNKEKAAHLVGMNSILYKFASNISEADLLKKIIDLNEDKNVHGILVQLPLPKHIDPTKVIKTISYKKDVDGFNMINVGKLSVGEIDGDDSAMIPCTPLGSIHLLKSALGDDLSGLKTLVVGTSNIVGRPLARLLMLEKCTVTIASSSTRDLKAECLVADVILTATGVANLIKGDMVKKGACVIDIGINRIDLGNGKTKLVGDVEFDSVKDVAGFITPVPGGVGPMTIAYLLQNTLSCFLKTKNK